MRFLGLMLDNSSQSTQRLINRFRIREDSGYIRFEDYYVAASSKSIHIFSTHSAAEVIFIQHVRVPLIIRLLIHISSFQMTWPDAPKVRIDAAARIKAPFAASNNLRNTLPPIYMATDSDRYAAST